MLRAMMSVFVMAFLGVTVLATPAMGRDKLTVGFFVLPPNAMVEDGRPSGIAIDYFTAHIAPGMGVDVDLVPLPFVRVMKSLELGRIDAVLLLGRNAERTAAARRDNQLGESTARFR